MKLDVFTQRMTLPASLFCGMWVDRGPVVTTTTVVLFDKVRITIDWMR